MSYFYTSIDADATAGRIKALRKAAGLTVRQVANYMGFEEPQAVYKWESGKSLPSLDNLVILAGLYRTTMDSIIMTKQIQIKERDDMSLSFCFIDRILGRCYNQKTVTVIKRESFRLCIL